MKIAIYVEGVTEAGFVYQLIGEHYRVSPSGPKRSL